MLQFRNDLEVVEALQSREMHIRKLAKELKTNPTSIMRLVLQLEKENVLKYKFEGKNKVYSLKGSLEAQQYQLMTEEYKFLKIIQNKELRGVCEELRENTQGELIVLFGSHAKGDATERSDIDVFIETKDRTVKKNLSLISGKLSLISGDLRKFSELREEIIKNHIIIQNSQRWFQLLKEMSS